MYRRLTDLFRPSFILLVLVLSIRLAVPIHTAFASQSGQLEPTPSRRTALPSTPSQTVPTITASWTPTPTPTFTAPKLTLTHTLTLTPTPLPAAYLENEFQTTTLLTGAVVLVIIILGGTLIGIRRHRAN